VNCAVLILPHADRDLLSLPEKERERVDAAILALGANPRPFGYKKLKDRNAHRIRVGVFRVIYKIDDLTRQVLVIKVVHRKEAYR